jgi:hypothetical protein
VGVAKGYTTGVEDGFELYVKGLIPREERPALTVLKRGAISFNQAAYGALGEPRAVQLLFSPQARVIGLRGTSPEHPSAHPVRRQKQTRSFLVAAKGFLRHYGISFEVSRRYRGELRGNTLVFDLTEPPIGTGRADVANDPETSNGQAPTRPGRSLKSSAPTRPPS